MIYSFWTDMGGFLWWLLIRFTRTELKEEQSKKYWVRNLFFLLVLMVMVLAIVI